MSHAKDNQKGEKRRILGAILSGRKDFQIKTGYLYLATYTRTSFIHVECGKTRVVDYYLTRLRLRLTLSLTPLRGLSVHVKEAQFR